jgi:hypothetical protein
MLMTLVIIDVSGAWSEGALSALDAALYLYGTARFYTFLRAVCGLVGCVVPRGRVHIQ